MASKAFSGVGTKVFRADTLTSSNPPFTAIAEINSVDGPNKSRDITDVTSLDSVGGYREFIPGFRDGGEVSCEMNFTPNGYHLMNNDFESDEAREYRLRLPNAENTEFDFDCYITSLGMSVPADAGAVKAKVTFKVTGPIRVNS